MTIDIREQHQKEIATAEKSVVEAAKAWVICRHGADNALLEAVMALLKLEDVE